MGILTNSQLTANFSAKYQLTTSIFLANSRLTTNFGFHFLQRILLLQHVNHFLG